jgi:hypothetical protein
MGGAWGMVRPERLFLAKDTLPAMDRLLDVLEAIPGEIRDRYAVPFFYAGTAARYEAQRIDENDRDNLSARVKALRLWRFETCGQSANGCRALRRPPRRRRRRPLSSMSTKRTSIDSKRSHAKKSWPRPEGIFWRIGRTYRMPKSFASVTAIQTGETSIPRPARLRRGLSISTAAEEQRRTARREFGWRSEHLAVEANIGLCARLSALCFHSIWQPYSNCAGNRR